MCEDAHMLTLPHKPKAEMLHIVQTVANRKITASVNYPEQLFLCGDTICANTSDLLPQSHEMSPVEDSVHEYFNALRPRLWNSCSCGEDFALGP